MAQLIVPEDWYRIKLDMLYLLGRQYVPLGIIIYLALNLANTLLQTFR